MTCNSHDADSIAPRSARAATVGWALRTAVYMLALYSLAFWQFRRWVDLRAAGGAVETAFLLLWSGSLPALWIMQRMESPRATTWARRLLWPTNVLFVVLLMNTARYYWLWWHDRIDHWPVPASLLAGLMLLAWRVACTRRLRLHARQPPTTRPRKHRWARRLLAVAYLVMLTAAGAWISLFQFRENPPPAGKRADLAVVFGHRVLPDGRAGVVMRDRTLAAISLWKARQVRYIMLSGSIDATKGGMRSEAIAMKQVCLDAGVPKEALIVDSAGVNTRATVAHSIQVMRDRKLTSIVAASSDYHLPRIGMTYRAEGIEVYAVASHPTEWVQAEPAAVARELVALTVYGLFPNYRRASVDR